MLVYTVGGADARPLHGAESVDCDAVVSISGLNRVALITYSSYESGAEISGQEVVRLSDLLSPEACGAFGLRSQAVAAEVADADGTRLEARFSTWVGQASPDPSTAPPWVRAAGSSDEATAAVPDTPVLLVSEKADRGRPRPLDGAVVHGDLFIFLGGAADAERVDFWLGDLAGDPWHSEAKWPFDLGGGREAAAEPVDGAYIGTGTAMLVAQITSRDGEVTTTTASFTVEPAPPAPPVPVGRAPTPGFPSLATTGVPTGVQLRQIDRLELRDGDIVEGVHLRGCLTVAADDVTLRNSIVECTNAGGGVIKVRGANFTLEDSEVDGLGDAGSCVGSGGYTLRRVEMRNCSDGARANTDVMIVESLIHQLARQEGSHNDAIQTTQGTRITIENNTLLAYDPRTDDPFNAAYIFGPATGEVGDVVFRDNYVDGGNHTVVTGTAGSVEVTGNRFGRNHRYGPVNGPHDPLAVWEDNRYADDGEPVDRP